MTIHTPYFATDAMKLQALILIASLLLLTCCAPRAHTLPPTASSELHAPSPMDIGSLIYRGMVVPEGQEDAAFYYERYVAVHGPNLTSTHRTYRTKDANAVVLQRAVHSPDYTLHGFEEIHGQTGTLSTVRVLGNGGLEFVRTRGAETETVVEPAGAPVVVGPTLFGYILHHWDGLHGGEVLTVRFAAAERAQSYAFDIRLVSASPDVTIIAFEASNFLVRLGVETMHLVFETQSRRILQYTGSVPPRLKGLESFDAQVRYEFIAPNYL